MSRGPFSPGDQCNQYRIVRPLGAGGYGCVYEAVREFQIMAKGVVQPFMHGVALKCLQVNRARDAKKLERMNLEAILLMDLKHDNIVGFLDWGVTDSDVFYFAMDLLQGKTLADHMSAGKFSVTRSLYVASEVAAGLAYAHEKHITHRDLKPSNIFVTDRWEIKVLDLGAAKHEIFDGISTTTGKAPCTVTYAAPEQLDGSGEVDHRADVFALGVIAYQMLAGEHPFSSGAHTRSEYAIRQLECRYRPLSDFGIPGYVSAVVHRALCKRARDRYASTHEMLDELRAVFVRHKEGRPAVEDAELADIMERRKLRARLERGDESDPNGRSAGWRWRDRLRAKEPVAEPRSVGQELIAAMVGDPALVAPEHMPTVIISNQTAAVPPKSVPSPRSTNGRRGATVMADLATHTASNRPGITMPLSSDRLEYTDEPSYRLRARRRMSFVIALWALSLVLVAVCWIVFSGPRASDVGAQHVMPPPAPLPAPTAVPEPTVLVPNSTIEVAARELPPPVVVAPAAPSIAPTAATQLAARDNTHALAIPAASAAAPKPAGAALVSKKRQGRMLDGIHVPKWDSLTDPFSGSGSEGNDGQGGIETVRRP